MKKLLFLVFATLLAAPLLAQSTQDDDHDAYILSTVEQQPQFPGGEEAMYRFIASNAHYPKEARENGIQGTVYLTFIVERDGSISNVRILRSPSDLLSEEASRVVKSMPRWKPGKAAGKNVRVQYTLPLHFQLQLE